jgi:hypothetical protein
MPKTDYGEDVERILAETRSFTIGHFRSDSEGIDVAFGLEVIDMDTLYTITHYAPGRGVERAYTTSDEEDSAISNLGRLWSKSIKQSYIVDLAIVLGFSRVETVFEERDNFELTTFPTVDYLNLSMDEIYADLPDAKYFRFAIYESPYGKVPGNLFIEALSHGLVLVSSHEDLSMLVHDIGDHSMGYCRIDPLTFLLIKEGAQRLVDENRLNVDEEGKLTDPLAKSFAQGVDLLSAYMNDFNPHVRLYEQFPNDRTKGIREIRKYIRSILHLVEDKTLLREVKLEQIYRGLIRHQYWLEDRSSSLLQAA